MGLRVLRIQSQLFLRIVPLMLGDPISPRTSKALLASNAYQNKWDIALEPLGLFHSKTNYSKHHKWLLSIFCTPISTIHPPNRLPITGCKIGGATCTPFSCDLSPPRNQRNTFTLLCDSRHADAVNHDLMCMLLETGHPFLVETWMLLCEIRMCDGQLLESV